MLCRYCRRTLKVIPLDPTQIEPHCTTRGCNWCIECYRGETSLSPVKGVVRDAD